MTRLHIIGIGLSDRKGGAIAAAQHRSGGPSDLSRQEASQPKALLTIAGALADLRGLATGTAFAFTILFLMRGAI